MDAAATAAQPRSDGIRQLLRRVVCVAVPLALWFAPLPVDPVTKHALAIALFMVLAWITEAVDHAVAGLIGCFLFWALGVVRFDVAFGGFRSEACAGDRVVHGTRLDHGSGRSRCRGPDRMLFVLGARRRPLRRRIRRLPI